MCLHVQVWYVCAHFCNALCGPRTKRTLSTSLQSPTLRLQTPPKVHVCCPGHWRSGDGVGKAGLAPPPWDLLKILPELKKNPIVTAATLFRQPKPEHRAELEKRLQDLSADQRHLRNARAWQRTAGPSAKPLPAFQMLAASQKVTSGLRQDFFPEELAGSSKHGSRPRAASGSNGIFLPSLSEVVVGGWGGGVSSLYIPLVLRVWGEACG